MRTEQGEWWATSLGTLPRTRRTPFIPLFPTTMRSAPSFWATDTMPSAGSSFSAWVTAVTPTARALEAKSSSMAEARLAGSTPSMNSSGSPWMLVADGL